MLTVLLLIAGCGGDGLNLEDLKGEVTFAGKPLVYGSIEFIPDTAQKHSGPAGNAEILDGKYDTREGGQGILPGAYLVRITGYEARPAPTSGDETVPSNAKPPLFVGYTIKSKLAAGAQNFEVPESARGFDLLNPASGAAKSNEP